MPWHQHVDSHTGPALDIYKEKVIFIRYSNTNGDRYRGECVASFPGRVGGEKAPSLLLIWPGTEASKRDGPYLVECKAFQLFAIELAWLSLPGEKKADINVTIQSTKYKLGTACMPWLIPNCMYALAHSQLT